MKKLISLLFISFITFSVNAQLKVDTDGKIRLQNQVSLGTTGFNVNAGLQLQKSQNSGTYYGLYSSINSLRVNISPRSITAVYGQIKAPTVSKNESSLPLAINSFCSGVAGLAQFGIGIYGAIGSSLPISVLGSYAGYFDGNVKTTGTMTAASYATSSDSRLKTDIADLSDKTSHLIYNLRPVSYKFNSTDTIHFRYAADAQELKNTHYGLIAQEVKELYPNLVYENKVDGYMSINYIELIPLLISTIQEQNERLSVLENEKSVSYKQSTQSSIIAKLYQNNPNPFNQSTVIKYDLPLETSQANLYIYDMTGAQIAAYSITEFGSSSITISAGNLKAGMYLYSLIADGQIIDTKQMILTK